MYQTVCIGVLKEMFYQMAEHVTRLMSFCKSVTQHFGMFELAFFSWRQIYECGGKTLRPPSDLYLSFSCKIKEISSSAIFNSIM